MLIKCMLNPINLARRMEWNAKIGKPSAVMAIDITNNCIGIALAYHRQHDVPNREASPHQTAESDENNTDDNSSTTSIVALPPIPYLSSDPYHPSYAFLHHHRQESVNNNVRGLDRVERTLEIADQLAQLAIERQVRGILVRWPGDLASTVSGCEKENEQTSQVEEGDLLLPNIQENSRADNTKKLADGSMGYMRGRILYVLDKCCSSHGHVKTNNALEPLLVEGNRPFALWDTSISEQTWISYEQENKHSKSKNAQPRIPKRQDKYGNSLTEMDLFGRAAIFGNQPPDPQQGKHRFSSKQQYSGYRVSTQFGSAVAKNEMSKNQQSLNENFDSFDIESRMNQFQGSLSAMHSLYDFVTEHLQGRVILPTWASTSSSSVSSSRAKSQVSNEGLFAERNDTNVGSQSKEESRKTEAALDRNTASSPIVANKQPKGLASLVQIPKRKGRRREKRG